MNEESKYSIEVFEEHAIIRGSLPTDVLMLFIDLCRKEGFTYLTHMDDGELGFKLVKE